MNLNVSLFTMSLIVAPLMLSAPALAEAWTCDFINPNTQQSEKLVIVRKGETFTEQFSKMSYRILNDTENTLQLFFNGGDFYPDMPLFLMIWKKGGQFTQILPGAGRNLEIFGTCETK